MTPTPSDEQVSSALREVEIPLSQAQESFVAEVRAAVDALASRPDHPAAQLAAIADAAHRRSASVLRGDVRGALRQLEACVDIDVDVPTASQRRPVAKVKGTVKRLVGWYVHFVGEQVSAFGYAAVALGRTMAERVEQIEDGAEVSRCELDELRTRVERLEAGPGHAPGDGQRQGR
ncbi:MAG: hypothetical protein ACR2K0_02120 [Acidimicrobiales bacterium]